MYIICITILLLGSPLLWIYDDAVLKAAIAGHPDTPEFHEPTANPYYHVPTGSLSHYGDQIIPILRSLAECKGMYNVYIIVYTTHNVHCICTMKFHMW